MVCERQSPKFATHAPINPNAGRQGPLEKIFGAAGGAVSRITHDAGVAAGEQDVAGYVLEEGGVERSGLIVCQRRHQPRLGAPRRGSLGHDGDAAARRLASIAVATIRIVHAVPPPKRAAENRFGRRKTECSVRQSAENRQSIPAHCLQVGEHQKVMGFTKS
jgi:hypothetical protein